MSELGSSLGPSSATGVSPDWKTPSSVKSVAASMKSILKSKLMDKDPTNIWVGSFVAPPLDNVKAEQHWLPNQKFGSAHISLCADVYIDPESISVEWDKIVVTA
jgi:hypothetical protein